MKQAIIIERGNMKYLKMVAIQCCDTCKHCDKSVVFNSNPPKFKCTNQLSGKQYVFSNEYCKQYEAEKADMNFVTTVSDELTKNTKENVTPFKLQDKISLTLKDWLDINLKLDHLEDRINALENKADKKFLKIF